MFGGKRRTVERLRPQADNARYAAQAAYVTLSANVVTPASRAPPIRTPARLWPSLSIGRFFVSTVSIDGSLDSHQKKKLRFVSRLTACPVAAVYVTLVGWST